VARLYAGILGLLAFVTTLVQGLLHQGNPESVLWAACCNLSVFALVGGFAGRMAAWIVEDATRRRLTAAPDAPWRARTPSPDSRPKAGT
jgi:hypothetical protein